MLDLIRKKFGPVMVSLIIGFIAFVFVFFGVYSPKTAGLRGGGTTAAMVNGDVVSVQEFAQTYQQRLSFYEGMMKGKVDPNMLRQLGLRRAVLEDLVRRKIMMQEADKLGLVVSDQEVAARIQQLPYFQKDGKFSPELYHKLLETNHRSAINFEGLMREDLTVSKISDFMRTRTRVSDEEVRRDYLKNGDQRQVQYALVYPDVAYKRMNVSEKEIQEFYKDEKNANAARLSFEQFKASKYKKAKSFEEVKNQVASELLKSRRNDEVRRLSQEVAQQVLARVKNGEKGLKSFLKQYDLEAKTSEKFNSSQNYLPGMGSILDLKQDAFKEQSPLASEPKVYESQGSFVVAWGLKTFKPDLVQLPKERDKVLASVQFRKERQFFDEWLQGAVGRSKVKYNEALLKEEADAADAEGHRAPVAASESGPEEY